MLYSTAHAAQPTEYEVKAAFIHNIVKYVEWPDASRSGASLRLCMLGQSPFGGALDALQGKAVGDRVWEIVLANQQTDLGQCRVLFIAASESDKLGGILEGIKHKAVLTVGDSDGFAERGVMVNFYLEQNKARFEINREAAARGGFRISSQLLKLARIVTGSGGEK
ncbi:MAG: YfiR family protein [Sideroxydans sp.]|nr:YfiR family protein [Sideroxydans sp.]